MNRNPVIEAYVVEVMRRLPGKDRNGIGYELRGLLTDMLAERAESSGHGADDAMVLALLREFGTPAEVAQRYRPPGMLVIPADQTRVFVPWAIAGVALQWVLTLPRVFEGQPLSTWWLTWGLGAFWWPGFLVMTSLAVAWLRQKGVIKVGDWSTRTYDPERVNRGVLAFGLLWFGCGVALVSSLPWIASRMPDPMSHILAVDPQFLRTRTWPVVLLWLGQFTLLVTVLVKGRWSTLTRHIEMVISIGFAAVLAWWISAGSILQAKASNDGARLALSFVILVIAIDVGKKWYRERTRICTPNIAG